MKSGATTVAGYLASLPAERRTAIAGLRALVNRHLPAGYREGMAYGMITWRVPLEVYPDTYNGQPLVYAALASQKRHLSLYLTCAHGGSGSERTLREAFARAGKKLDMGKSCVRFRDLSDLHLPAIAEVIRASGMRAFVERAKAAQRARSGKGAAKAATRPAAKRAPARAPRATAAPAAKTPARRRASRPAAAPAAKTPARRRASRP